MTESAFTFRSLRTSAMTLGSMTSQQQEQEGSQNLRSCQDQADEYEDPQLILRDATSGVLSETQFPEVLAKWRADNEVSGMVEEILHRWPQLAEQRPDSHQEEAEKGDHRAWNH